jgi:hypothetical protein
MIRDSTASRLGKYSLPLISLLRAFIIDLRLRLRSIVAHPLFKLTLVGLAIRLVLAPLTQFTYDPVVWYSAGNDMLAGLSPYYTKTYSYPPLWAYTYFPFLLVASLLVDPRTFGTHIAQMDWISLVLGYSPTILSPVFLLAVKLPLIIADIVTGFLIYRLARGFSTFNLARKAYVFWLFNPLVIWTSAVHGAFDVVPAMFTVLALAFVLRAKYIQTGMSLSIAILYKLYPVYLLPLYAILVWTDLGRERSFRTAFRQSAKRLMMFASGGALPLLVSLPFVSLNDMLHTLIVRQAYLSSMGGISPWEINNAPGFEWIWNTVATHMALITLATSAFAFGVSSVTGWFLVRRGPIETVRLLKAHVVGISAIFLSLVAVNPQYVVWALPFLTLAMYCVGLYRRRSMVLTALGLGWQLAISGPLILLPMSYFGLRAQILTSPVQSILSNSGIVFNPVLFLCGLSGGLVTISFVLRREVLSTALSSRIAPVFSLSRPSGFKHLRLSLRRAPGVLLVVFIIGIYSISAIFAQTSLVGRFVPTNVNSTVTRGTLTTHDSFLVYTGKLPLQLSLVAAPIASLGKDRPVFIYYDAAYPSLGNEPSGWIGIADHLPAELSLRGYSGPVQTVNATGLRRVLTQNFTSILVIPSGVFPSTVQNSTQGLVHDWLTSGGVLVWMGGPFGYYSGPAIDRILNPMTTNMSIASEPQQQILGYQFGTPALNGTIRIADLKTRFSSALNLTYSDVWTAPTLGALRLLGGVAIGHTQNSSDTSRSSISLIPVGLGRILIFGGPVGNLLTADGEDVIAHDIAQVLSLGDLAFTPQIQYSTFDLSPGVSTLLSFTASFNLTSTSIQGLSLVAFSNYGYTNMFWRMQLSAG